jgi:hypothetical protein
MGKQAFAFVALFTLMLSGIGTAALYVDSYAVTPSTLNPGQEGAVSFTIKNVVPTGSTSTTQLENVQVFYSAPQGIEYKSQSPYVVGTIAVGGSSLVTVPFKVNPDAKGGAITAPFYISLKDDNSLKTVNAVISVTNPAILSFSSDHQTILSTDAINLTITNNGGAASRATLKISDSSKFSLLGRTSIYIGDIKGAVSVEVPLDSRNADEGVNGIPFVISYTDEGGSSMNETKTLSVALKKEKADVVFFQQTPVVAAKDNMLSIKVKNTGRALEDFKVYLDDAHIKPRESNQVKLGSLQTGAEKSFTLEVFADAKPGVQATSFRLKWVEDDVEKEEIISVPIVVSSDADTAIFIDAKPTPIVVGGEHTLSVLVSNIGSYKINNVEVSLGESGALDILNAQKSQYIGGLESDDFSTVQYKARVKTTQPGSYPLVVAVKYKDQSGQWVSKNASIQLNIRPAEDGAKSADNGIVPIAIGAVALVGAGYWYFRMRKSGKPLTGDRK